ncbi:MAG: 50S ribosomal protein L3 [Nanoarchaeota archaeon]
MGRGNHKPRGGSLQFWPRKRAKRIYPRVRSWAKQDAVKLLGFAGYKVGMTHVIIADNIPNSLTKGMQVSYPVTVIECPPLKLFSLRLYKNTPYGLRLVSEIFAPKLDKEINRRLNLPKENKEKQIIEDADELRLVVYTQPKLIGLKKKPELFEVALGGTVKDGLEYRGKILNNEIKLREVIKEGQFVDVHSVTKGKGFQGPIKRFGLSLKGHKSEKKKRSAGNLGPWIPSKVKFTVPQHGQMGYHTRTEYNKLVLFIGEKPEQINPKPGFNHYGFVKSDYLLVKGSVPGPTKRLVRLTEPIRQVKKIQPLEIRYIAK